MSALVIGRNEFFEFLAPGCKGTWFKVSVDLGAQVGYHTIIVTLKGDDAERHKNFLRDAMRGDNADLGKLNRWIEFLVLQPWATVFTIGTKERYGGAVVYHKPHGEISVMSQPYCLGRLGDDFDGYIIQRAFDNIFASVTDNGKDDDEAAELILEKLEEAGAIFGKIFRHEYK